MAGIINISAGKLGPTEAINFPTPPEGYDTASWLMIGRNNLTVCPEFPANVGGISIKSNPITELPPIPETCRFLTVEGTEITTVPPIPALLRTLDMKRNKITKTPSLRHCPELYHVSFSFNNITEITDFPPRANGIGIMNNPVKFLPPLPPTLINFTAANTQLKQIPELPNTLEFLNLENCPLDPPFVAMLAATNGGNAIVRHEALQELIPMVRSYYKVEKRRGVAGVAQTFAAAQAANSALAGKNTLGAPGGPANLIASFLTGKPGSLAQQKAALGGGNRTRRKNRKQQAHNSRRNRK